MNGPQVCKLLLENGVDIDDRFIDEKTSLHIAAMEGLTKMCQFLIDKNADANVVDKMGKSPLHNAAIYGTPQVQIWAIV